MGFGIFNVVEGIVDHQLLGIHHENETVSPEQWIYWDMGFLVWGPAMLIGGWPLLRAGKQDTARKVGTASKGPGDASRPLKSCLV